VLIFGSLVGATGLTAAGFAPTIPVMFGALLVSGIGAAAVPVAGMTAILTHFPPERRGRILGLRQMAVPVGGFVAAGLLPVLYHFGGLELAFSVPATLVLAFGFLFAYAAGPGQRQADLPAMRASFPVPLRWVMLTGALYVTTLGGVLTFTVSAAHDAGLSETGAAIVFAALNLGAAAARVVWGFAADSAGGTRRVATLSALGVLGAATVIPFPFALRAGVVPGVIAAVFLAFGTLGFNGNRLRDRGRGGRALGRCRGRRRVDRRVPDGLDHAARVRLRRGEERLRCDVRVAGRVLPRRRPDGTPDRAPCVHSGLDVKTRERQRGRGPRGLPRVRRVAVWLRLDDFVLFVDRALPGDRVRARVTKVKRSYGEAIAVETLVPGPDRVVAPCPALRCLRRLQVAGSRLRRAAGLEGPADRRRAEAHRPPGRLRAGPDPARDPHLRLSQQARVLVRRDRGRPVARVPPRRPLGRDHARLGLPADVGCRQRGAPRRRGLGAPHQRRDLGSPQQPPATYATSWCARRIAPASCC